MPFGVSASSLTLGAILCFDDIALVVGDSSFVVWEACAFGFDAVLFDDLVGFSFATGGVGLGTYFGGLGVVLLGVGVFLLIFVRLF